MLYNCIAFAQLTPYLWVDELSLKKEIPVWIEKTSTLTEIKEGVKKSYLFSKRKFVEEGKQEFITYTKEGKIKDISHIYYEDEFTQVLKTEEGDVEIKKYNKDYNLVSEIWNYPDNSKDVKEFFYENGKLVKIIEKDEFETSIEVLQYENDKLSAILSSIGKRKKVIMKRLFFYDEEGKLSEMHREQKKEVNKKVFYSYNNKGQLILKEEKKINRLTGNMMMPEITDYSYYDNGVLKEENWIVYANEEETEKKYETITTYNNKGIVVKDFYKDYKSDFTEITEYSYKFK